jgi:hypothetical protein
MKRDEKLKKKLIKDGVLSLIMVLCACAMYLYFDGELKELKNYVTKLEGETLRLKKQTSQNEERNTLIAKSLKIYSSLPAQRGTQNSLDNSSARIRIAFPIIEDLYSKHKFADANIVFSPTVENVTKDFDTETVEVYANNIIIEYKALTDELVYSFIDAVIEKLPGYTTLERLEIEKAGILDARVLNRIRSNPKSLPHLITGKAIFRWWTTKDKQDKEKEKEGA